GKPGAGIEREVGFMNGRASGHAILFLREFQVFSAQGGRNALTFLKTGQASTWAPGRYPRLIKNSPTISPPVKTKVLRKSLTHSSLDKGWCASSQAANEPCV